MSTSCFLDDTTFEIINQQFGLSEEEFTRHVAQLHQWLVTQPHLPHEIDQVTLQKFVVNAKLSKEKAETKLDAYFTVRKLVPYVFSNRDPLSPEIRECNSCIYLGFLPGITENNARCAIIRLRDPDPDCFNITSFLRRWYFLMDIWIREDNFVNKIYVIVDTTGCGVRHMVKISPKRVRENALCYQDVYPISLEGVEFLNASPLVKVVLEKFMKPMLREKISRKFFVYSDGKSKLLNHLEKSSLPKEYGGGGPTLEEINGKDKWINEVDRNRDWLMSQGSLVTDETKRRKKTNGLDTFVMILFKLYRGKTGRLQAPTYDTLPHKGVEVLETNQFYPLTVSFTAPKGSKDQWLPPLVP